MTTEHLQSSVTATFERQLPRRDGRVLTIGQYEVGDVGCVVWDAAIVLSYYLESEDFTDENGQSALVGKTVVELGAGTGIVGIQAAACGSKISDKKGTTSGFTRANCVITDLEELVPLIKRNIETNQAELRGTAQAETLNWEDDSSWSRSAPDYVMIADCIYYDASVGPLHKTICRLCDSHTVVLCCYEERLSGNKPELLRRFLQLLREDFVVEQIPQSRHDYEYQSEDIHILKMTKKS